MTTLRNLGTHASFKEKQDVDYIKRFLYEYGLEKAETKKAAFKRAISEYAEYLRRLSDEERSKLSKDSNVLLETKLDINKEDFNYLTEVVQTIAQSTPVEVNVEEKTSFSPDRTYYVYEIVPGYYLAKLADLDKYCLSQNMSLENLKLTSTLDKAEIFEDEDEIINLDLDTGKIKRVYSVLEPHFYEVSGEAGDLSDYDIRPNKFTVTSNKFEVEKLIPSMTDDELTNEPNKIHTSTLDVPKSTITTVDSLEDDIDGEPIDDLVEDEFDDEPKLPSGGLFGGNPSLLGEPDEDDE